MQQPDHLGSAAMVNVFTLFVVSDCDCKQAFPRAAIYISSNICSKVQCLKILALFAGI